MKENIEMIKEKEKEYNYNNGDREMGDYLNDKQIGKHITLTNKGEVETKLYK